MRTSGMVVVVVGLGLGGCAKDPNLYDNTLFELGAGFNARMTCECVFVMEQTEAACRAWTRVSPDVARGRVDREAGTVTSRVLGGAKTVARFVDAQVGCVIDEEASR